MWKAHEGKINIKRLGVNCLILGSVGFSRQCLPENIGWLKKQAREKDFSCRLVMLDRCMGERIWILH